MKTVFLATNLVFGLPGLLLGLAASSDAARNPVAAVIGVVVLGLAATCLWLAKAAASSDSRLMP